MELPANFRARIVVSDSGCWLWSGRLVHGYGQVAVGQTTKRAHRYVYEALLGPIPDGLTLDHLCRVRNCVNPDHLEPVTQRENLMRSELTIAARNAAKSHCVHGHSLADARIYDNKRECRTCERLRQERKRRARGAAIRVFRKPL